MSGDEPLTQTAHTAPVLLLALGLTACSCPDIVVLEVEIGPERIDCPGGLEPNKQCMVMDGEPFYDWIEGFDYEEGYTWTLKVRRVEPWGEDGAPQTEIPYVYCFLLEIVSKVPE